MHVLLGCFSESDTYIWLVCGMVRIKEQLNPKWRGDLDGKMGSIHGSQWSLLATPNNEA